MFATRLLSTSNIASPAVEVTFNFQPGRFSGTGTRK